MTNLTICVHEKESYEDYTPKPDDGTTYSNIFDCIYFNHRGHDWILASSSDHTISFWRYDEKKNTVQWVNQITTEVVQKKLCLVPPSQVRTTRER